MKIGFLGRTTALLDSARVMRKSGFEVVFICTSRSPDEWQDIREPAKEFCEQSGALFIEGVANLAHAQAMGLPEADVVVSINWPAILPASFLTSFRFGVINAHMGDLPRYRGNACPNWAILEGESKVVLTIHRMTEELDGGPILVQASLPLSDETYIGAIYDWFHASVPALFLQAINNLVMGLEVAQSSEIRPLRTFPRMPEDSRLRWEEPRTRLLRLIRASSRPFRGAFCFFGDNLMRVTVWRAESYEPEYDFRAVPGQICLRAENDLVVACGDGMIRLLEIDSPYGDHNLSSAKIGASLRNRLL